MLHPVVERGLARFMRAHAVALIAVVPGRNGGVVLQRGDEVLHEARLPHDRSRVDEDVLLLEDGRHELASAHPARDDADDELDVVLLRDVAEEAEAPHHLLVHAGLVLERLVVLEEGAVAAARVAVARERLEVRPEREDAHHGDAVLRELGEFALHDIRRPLAPHVHTGVLRPVVAADEELAVREDVPRRVVRRRRGQRPATGTGGERRRNQELSHVRFPFLILQSFSCSRFVFSPFSAPSARRRPGGRRG